MHRLCNSRCIQFVEKVCFFKKALVLNPYPQTPFPVVKGCVCLVGSASCRAFGHTRPASVPGLSVGLPPSPRLGLRPKPHFQKLYRFIDSLKSVSPDTDFLLPIIAGYRQFPTVLQSPANCKPFKRSEAECLGSHFRL